MYPGRWNERGRPVVYTAGSLSLAAMEMLVHLDAPELLELYLCIPVEFDDSLCLRLSPEDLPADWAADPTPDSARRLGSAWLDKGESAVLAVPSAIVPLEYNFLMNPRHEDFSRLRIGAPDKFRFDPRLLKRG